MVRVPRTADLGRLGEVMNPMDSVHLIEPAIALGPTRVIGLPQAGYATFRRTGLGDYRDALDALATFSFLFP